MVSSNIFRKKWFCVRNDTSWTIFVCLFKLLLLENCFKHVSHFTDVEKHLPMISRRRSSTNFIFVFRDDKLVKEQVGNIHHVDIFLNYTIAGQSTSTSFSVPKEFCAKILCTPSPNSIWRWIVITLAHEFHVFTETLAAKWNHDKNYTTHDPDSNWRSIGITPAI